MPQKVRVPALVHHRPTGQARVRFAGRDHYLGRYGTPEAEERYRRLVAELLVTGDPLPSTRPSETPHPGLSVNELILAYWRHAEGYYVKGGRPTSELKLVREILRLLREHYGSTPASEFSALKLKALREVMISRRWCRKGINQRVGRIRRAFKWAVENELIGPAVYQSLAAVAGLKKGRTEAKESEPVKPADPAAVDTLLPRLNRQLAAMVKLQTVTGMRPGEVCRLRPQDVDTTDQVWVFSLPDHKTAHCDRNRLVFIGPRGQEILRPWLGDRPADAYCFSPAEARDERAAARRSARKTPVQPSQRHRRKERPRKAPGAHYTTMSYGHAIRNACLKLNEQRRKARLPEIAVWHPNQLRHAAATQIRKAYGIEAAQTVLGHADGATTAIYAERDLKTARRVMLEVG